MLSRWSINPRFSRLAGVAIAALALSYAAAARTADHQQARPTEGPAGAYVSEDSLSRIRYSVDGQLSMNDRCPVRAVRLNVHLDPLYVNGRPIGFC